MPKLTQIGTIVSAHGDPEAFGEREIEIAVNLRAFHYDTPVYAGSIENLKEELFLLMLDAWCHGEANLSFDDSYFLDAIDELLK